MKLLTSFIIVFTIIFPVILNASPRGKYLNSGYANNHYYSVNEKDNPSYKKAIRLLNEGISLYKQKKDSAAIIKYENSLDYYTPPETYYHYGNSLSNIGELADSIKAYEISIELNYEKSFLSYYNIACSYSRLKKTNESFQNLKLSILNGYPSIQYISNDSDLAHLRSSGSWQNRYKQIVSLYEKGNNDFLINKRITHGYASSMDEYTFFKDGQVKVYYKISEARNHHRSGTYTIQHYIITIHWDNESGEEGIGNPVFCASTCSYSKYKKFSKTINDYEILKWYTIDTNEYGHWNIEDHKESF
jgi:tetratricopeptide (TPR) repeat protein